jgi:hypothetical protein
MQQKWSSQPKYQRDPQLKLKDVEGLFKKAVEEQQKGRTIKQVQSNKAVAEEMAHALQKERTIDNIYDRDRETGKLRKIDLTKFYGIEEKAITIPRVKKKERLVKALKKEEVLPGEEVLTPQKMSGQMKQLINTYSKQLKRAKERGDIAAIKTYQDELADIESGLKAGGRRHLLGYRQLRTVMEEEEKLTRLDIKDNDYLKRSLEAQGVDTHRLRSTKQIRDAVKSFNLSVPDEEKDRLIGLRHGQVNRSEMISELTRNTSIPKSAYEEMTSSRLKKEWNHIAPFKTKKKDFFMVDMFPAKDSEERIKTVNKFYHDAGLKPLTRKQKEAIRLEVAQSKPHLTGSDLRQAFAEELYSRAYNQQEDVTVPSKEIEKRLMYWKYKDPDKMPSPDDRLEFSQMDSRKFRRVLDKIGPGIMQDGSISGPYSPDIETIPSKMVTEYRKNMKKDVGPLRSALAEQAEARAEEARTAERLDLVQMRYPF